MASMMRDSRLVALFVLCAKKSITYKFNWFGQVLVKTGVHHAMQNTLDTHGDYQVIF